MTRKLDSYSELTQGLIFNGVQLQSSTGYGIVINADCDIAQKKIKNISYIAIYPFKKFICNIYCPEYVKSMVEKWASARDVSLEFIENSILHNVIPLEKWRLKFKIDELLCLCFNKKIFPETCCEKCFVQKNDKLKNFISNLLKDSLAHYFYLPDLGSDAPEGGVAHFLEIRSLPFTLAEKIPSGLIPRPDEQKKYNLSAEIEFIMPIGSLKSPYREHFMQRFIQHFARIGLDDLDGGVAKNLIDSLGKVDDVQ